MSNNASGTRATASKFVTTSQVVSRNIGSAPNATASILSKLPRGSQVNIYTDGISNGFAQLVDPVAGQIGYASMQWLSDSMTASSTVLTAPTVPVTPPAVPVAPVSSSAPVTIVVPPPPVTPAQTTPAKRPTATKMVTTAQGVSLNIRSGPSTTSSILSKLPRGTQVTVYTDSINNGFAQLVDPVAGQIGYVSLQFLAD